MGSDDGYEGHLTQPGLFIQEKEMFEGWDIMPEELRNAQWQTLRDALFTLFTVLPCVHQMNLYESD